jgi:hypothetical protein
MLAAVALASPITVRATAPARVISYPASVFAPFQPTSALDMLAHLPGFTFDGGGQVRGFADAAGNVLVDGARPASKDDSLDDVLRRIPASSVERIEIILGGAPGLDMQGKTVLANVVRRRDIPGKLTVNASATHGLDNQISGALLIEAEKRVGETSYEGSLRVAKFLDSNAGAGTWTRADGEGTPFVSAREYSNGAADEYKLTGAMETPVQGGKLRINASVAADPYAGRQSETLIPAPGVENDRYGFEQDSAEVGLRYERGLGGGLTSESFLVQRLGRQSSTDNFLGDAETAARTGDDVSADFDLRKTTAETIARSKLTLQASRALSLDLGGEGDFNWLTSHTLYSENGVPTALPAADVHVEEMRGEAFAKAVWQALPSLNAEGALRLEASHIDSSGDVVSARTLTYLKPRLALAWSPDAGDQLRLRLEREVGQLDFDDFTAQVAGLNTGTVHAGNPTLDPDQDWVAEGAWERRFWRGADATVTLRHYWLEDVVDRVGVASPSGTYDAPGNIGSGTRDEAVFALTLPTDRLGLARGLITGEATLRQSRVIDPTTGAPRPISGLHQSDWAAHFTQGLPRWKASWGADVLGPWVQTFYRFDEIDTDKLKPYVILFAEYKPRADLTFKIEALNPVGQGSEHSRQVFDGPRGQFGADFTDVHQLRTSHYLRARVVKSFQ